MPSEIDWITNTNLCDDGYFQTRRMILERQPRPNPNIFKKGVAAVVVDKDSGWLGFKCVVDEIFYGSVIVAIGCGYLVHFLPGQLSVTPNAESIGAPKS